MEKVKPWLGEPQNTIAVLQKYGFVFQKKYGQNFLIDPHVLDKIVAAAGIGPDDFVVEIGPGIGTLTQYLAYAARSVCAVEIDKNLIPILEDTLSDYDNVEVINNDVLKVDLARWRRRRTTDGRSRLWRIFRIILRRRLLWDYLRIMCRWIRLRLWFRRRLRTGCRRGRDRRITGRCRWRCSIMRSRILWRMCRRTVLCRGRRLEVR